MWENTMAIMFVILLAVPLILLSIYLWYNTTQRYKINKILYDIKQSTEKEIHERFVLILKSGLKHVNGWNLLAALYAGMYYCFNFGKCKNPELRIVIYANSIVKIEESIKDEDLL